MRAVHGLLYLSHCQHFLLLSIHSHLIPCLKCWPQAFALWLSTSKSDWGTSSSLDWWPSRCSFRFTSLDVLSLKFEEVLWIDDGCCFCLGNGGRKQWCQWVLTRDSWILGILMATSTHKLLFLRLMWLFFWVNMVVFCVNSLSTTHGIDLVETRFEPLYYCYLKV